MRRALPLLLLLPLLGACAQGPADDPLEALNRHIFEFNDAMDAGLIRPAAESYRANVPAPARAALRNAMRNLNEPVNLANHIFQLRFEDAGVTLLRFAANTTMGAGGLVEVAEPAGLTHRPNDFGRTLFGLGVEDGPYLVLPLLGPSNLRDAVGRGVDTVIDPVQVAIGGFPGSRFNGASFGLGIGRAVVGGLDLRERNLETLDALRADSLDFYARLRSVVRQRRDAELGRTREADPMLLDDPGEAP